MRKIKTFMDWLLFKDWDGEHINRNIYSSIYGKCIYPVAFNPLNCKKVKSKSKYKIEKYTKRMSSKARYNMVRNDNPIAKIRQNR